MYGGGGSADDNAAPSKRRRASQPAHPPPHPPHPPHPTHPPHSAAHHGSPQTLEELLGGVAGIGGAAIGGASGSADVAGSAAADAADAAEQAEADADEAEAEANPLSDSRRSRGKVSESFRGLARVVGDGPGAQPRTQREILIAARERFGEAVARKEAADSVFVLSSRAALRDWALRLCGREGGGDVAPVGGLGMAGRGLPQVFVDEGDTGPARPLGRVCASFGELCCEFAKLFCVARRWSYGEVWLLPGDRGGSVGMAFFKGVLGASVNALIVESLRAMSASAGGSPPRCDLADGVARTSRPEWRDIGTTAGVRMVVAQAAGVRTALGIPMLGGSGRVRGVLIFFDEQPRVFDDRAMRRAVLHGNTLVEVWEEVHGGNTTGGAGRLEWLGADWSHEWAG